MTLPTVVAGQAGAIPNINEAWGAINSLKTRATLTGSVPLVVTSSTITPEVSLGRLIYTCAWNVDHVIRFAPVSPRDIPAGASVGGLRFLWYCDANAGSVLWRLTAIPLVPGAAIAVTGSTTDSLVAVPGSANTLTTTTITSPATVDPGATWLDMRLTRVGTDASDTVETGTPRFVAAELVYDRPLT